MIIKWSDSEQFQIVLETFKVNLVIEISLICWLISYVPYLRTAWSPAWGVLTWSHCGPITAAALPMRTHTAKQGTFLLSLSLILSQKPSQSLRRSSKWVTMRHIWPEAHLIARYPQGHAAKPNVGRFKRETTSDSFTHPVSSFDKWPEQN